MPKKGTQTKTSDPEPKNPNPNPPKWNQKKIRLTRNCTCLLALVGSKKGGVGVGVAGGVAYLHMLGEI